MSMRSPMYWLSAIGAGVIVGAIWFGVNLATGQTFGQRCSVWHETDSPDWNACVHRFAKG